MLRLLAADSVFAGYPFLWEAVPVQGSAADEMDMEAWPREIWRWESHQHSRFPTKQIYVIYWVRLFEILWVHNLIKMCRCGGNLSAKCRDGDLQTERWEEKHRILDVMTPLRKPLHWSAWYCKKKGVSYHPCLSVCCASSRLRRCSTSIKFDAVCKSQQAPMNQLKDPRWNFPYRLDGPGPSIKPIYGFFFGPVQTIL